MPFRSPPLKLNPSPIKPRDSRPPYFDHHVRAAHTAGRVVKSDQVDYTDPSQSADESADSGLAHQTKDTKGAKS